MFNIYSCAYSFLNTEFNQPLDLSTILQETQNGNKLNDILDMQSVKLRMWNILWELGPNFSNKSMAWKKKECLCMGIGGDYCRIRET